MSRRDRDSTCAASRLPRCEASVSRHTFTANRSQAAWQGLAVSMASAVVVLKHNNLTLRKSHNFISIDLKFGLGDNVREVINSAKFGSGLMSGRNAT